MLRGSVMKVVLVVLWLTSLLLIAANRSSPVFRWLSLLTFCGGMGALASIMEDWITVYEAGDTASQIHAAFLRQVQTACSWTSYYGLPYSFLLFAASYHQLGFAPRSYRLLPYIALIPPFAMLLVPIEDGYPVAYGPLGCWAIPYAIAAAAMIVTKRVDHAAERRAHLIVTAAVLPAMLFALAMNYALPLFGIYRMWRYNIWSIPIAFCIFIIALFKYGFLGVQLMIERRRLDYSMRAITSGTAMLNHSIKNDIAKIKLFADKVNRDGTGVEGLHDDVAVITRSAEHIEAMIRSVHERTQELTLRLEQLDLKMLAVGQLEPIRASAERQGIQIVFSTDQTAEAVVLADAAQTEEAVHNVLCNALEAMPKGGKLTVAVYGGKRGAVLEITDTGCGIEKQHLHKVMEPFYTTKSGSTMNFGLGLAYCSQLMNRQGGELRIRSELGNGTTVSFFFPEIKRRRRLTIRKG